MKILFVFAPVALLLFAWLLGHAKLTRAFVAFALWVLMCEVIIVSSIFSYPPNPAPLVLGVLLLFLSIPVGVLVGLTGRRDPAPVVVAAEAYDALTPDQKARLHKGAGTFARFAAKHVGNHLRDKGYTRTAEGLNEAAKFI